MFFSSSVIPYPLFIGHVQSQIVTALLPLNFLQSFIVLCAQFHFCYVFHLAFFSTQFFLVDKIIFMIFSGNGIPFAQYVVAVMVFHIFFRAYNVRNIYHKSFKSSRKKCEKRDVINIERSRTRLRQKCLIYKLYIINFKFKRLTMARNKSDSDMINENSRFFLYFWHTIVQKVLKFKAFEANNK